LPVPKVEIFPSLAGKLAESRESRSSFPHNEHAAFTKLIEKPMEFGPAQRPPDAFSRKMRSHRAVHFLGFSRCEKALHYRIEWWCVYAMLIGYARVSTGDQATPRR